MLDGYELLVPDFDCASEVHGTSVNIEVPTGLHMGAKVGRSKKIEYFELKIDCH